MTAICSRCGSTEVAPSGSRGFFDWFFQTFGYHPYRCQICSYRFFYKDHKQQPPRKKKRKVVKAKAKAAATSQSPKG
ncbi:MAG: hypothetical protein ACRD8O_10040 [Bryobacteraceae bacterium]